MDTVHTHAVIAVIHRIINIMWVVLWHGTEWMNTMFEESVQL